MSKVVLIDGDPFFRRNYNNFLERNGHEVVCFERTYSEFVDEILEAEPDLVLCDTNIFPTPGYDFCQQLQEEGYSGDIIGMSVSHGVGPNWSRRGLDFTRKGINLNSHLEQHGYL